MLTETAPATLAAMNAHLQDKRRSLGLCPVCGRPIAEYGLSIYAPKAGVCGWCDKNVGKLLPLHIEIEDIAAFTAHFAP